MLERDPVTKVIGSFYFPLSNWLVVQRDELGLELKGLLNLSIDRCP